VGVWSASDAQGDILYLGGHQGGPAAVLHVPRAPPEDVLQALAVHHVPIALEDQHHPAPLRGGVLDAGASGLVLEERLQGLDDTWNGRGGGGSQTLVGVIFGVPAVVTSYCTRGGRRSSVTGIYFQFTNATNNIIYCPGLTTMTLRVDSLWSMNCWTADEVSCSPRRAKTWHTWAAKIGCDTGKSYGKSLYYVLMTSCSRSLSVASFRWAMSASFSLPITRSITRNV